MTKSRKVTTGNKKRIAALAMAIPDVSNKINALIDAHIKPKEKTQHDLDRINAAKQKRLRKQYKRIINNES